MDFVVSKVAMSACALMVVTILAGMVEQGMLFDDRSELEGIVRQFCSLAGRMMTTGSEAKVGWTVPSLADGQGIEFRVERRVVTGKADEMASKMQPMFDIHTWEWDGRGLNESVIASFDGASPGIVAVSGRTVFLEASSVILDDEPRLLLFASLPA